MPLTMRRVAKELAAPRTVAAVLDIHRLLEVARGDGGDDARDLVRVTGEVLDDLVDRRDVLGPAAGRAEAAHALGGLAFLADGARRPRAPRP